MTTFIEQRDAATGRCCRPVHYEGVGVSDESNGIRRETIKSWSRPGRNYHAGHEVRQVGPNAFEFHRYVEGSYREKPVILSRDEMYVISRLFADVVYETTPAGKVA